MTGESLSVFICPPQTGCNCDPEEKNAFAYAEEAGGNLYSSSALIVVNDITVESKYFLCVRFHLLVSISQSQYRNQSCQKKNSIRKSFML